MLSMPLVIEQSLFLFVEKDREVNYGGTLFVGIHYQRFVAERVPPRHQPDLPAVPHQARRRLPPRSVERLRLQPFAAGQLHASGQGHVRVGLRVGTANPGLKDNKHTLLDERVPEELKLLVQLTLGKMLGERSRIWLLALSQTNLTSGSLAPWPPPFQTPCRVNSGASDRRRRRSPRGQRSWHRRFSPRDQGSLGSRRPRGFWCLVNLRRIEMFLAVVDLYIESHDTLLQTMRSVNVYLT